MKVGTANGERERGWSAEREKDSPLDDRKGAMSVRGKSEKRVLELCQGSWPEGLMIRRTNLETPEQNDQP